ncbi:hypothetical protein SLS58_006523 [Diplodia intermedia]|uniref:Uncharacterized protein n=1 Tax=Diplodia intermedia TaxID=856260 RepID=A0ABR3TMU5_9PEZI
MTSEAWPPVPRNTSKFYGTVSAFLNVHRVGYLYEIEAVNAAHVATFVVKYKHSGKDNKRLRALHVEVTIVPQGARPMMFGRVLEIRVSWVTRSNRKLSFDVPAADFPLALLDKTLPAQVTCFDTSQRLRQEYDSMNALAGMTMDGSGSFDFWDMVLGVCCWKHLDHTRTRRFA